MYKNKSFCEASTGFIIDKHVCLNRECDKHTCKVSEAEASALGEPICYADWSIQCEYYNEEYANES